MNKEGTMPNSNDESGFDYLLVLDFEAQCIEDGKLEVQEIIEFPVLVIDSHSQNILEKYFHAYVRPTINPNLYPFCMELTGITQEQVDKGNPLEETLYNLHLFLEENKIISSNFVFVTCGDWDLRNCLKKETRSKKIQYRNYLKNYINLKKVFRSFIGLDEKTMVDMVSMLNEFNIKLEGRHHSGIDYAKNIAKIIVHLLKKGQKFTKKFVSLVK